MDIGLTDSWITLTIKAPNQQIDDQTVKCKLDWSVAKLKGYIRETYPNKPKTEDQRLIYSGQLLTDSVILKDILRPYDEDGQLNRIVHLVCASSSFCIPPKILEKRKIERPKINDVNIGASTSGTNIPTAVNQEASTSFSTIKNEKKTTRSGTKTNSSNVNRTPLTPERIALKQMVWMNKMYAIRMAEYWKSVASSLGAPTLPNTQNINNESPNPLPNNDNNNQQVEQNDAPVNNEDRNIQDFGPNHDWLDWLYVSSRVFIFISVLYFYSSPGRFIVVVSFALLLYLYQSGILRHINEYNRRRFRPAEPQEQNTNTNETTAVAQDEPLFSFIWTVFSTFFTSLIPQQPDII